MVTIKISKFFLEFEHDQEEKVQQFIEGYQVEEIKGKKRVYDQPEKLYNIILEISKIYDIEII